MTTTGENANKKPSGSSTWLAPTLVKYTEKWERGLMRLRERWQQRDNQYGYEEFIGLIDHVRPEFGAYPVSFADLICSEIRWAKTVGAKLATGPKLRGARLVGLPERNRA